MTRYDGQSAARGSAPRGSNLAAVVLAAGAGTRLRPLTDHRPKALCSVNNVALVDHAIAHASAVTTEVAVNVHHGREQLEPHLAGRVHVSIEEPVALGTAGAIGALRGWLDGRDALVLNADAWRTGDLRDLLADWDGDRIRLLVVDDPGRGDFGRWRFAGASLLPWSVARTLEPEPAALDVVCWRAADSAGRLDLAPTSETFIDCGTPADYLRANMAASGGETVVAPDAVVNGEAIRSVIWPGARVARGERLVDAIRIGADLTVTPLAVGTEDDRG
ncbi:MAG: sugar phosphate nucleotidyltransferase [Mycobacteriales bacterium]|nr:NTP transferase domain-containing protein [Frankia sp.]